MDNLHKSRTKGVAVLPFKEVSLSIIGSKLTSTYRYYLGRVGSCNERMDHTKYYAIDREMDKFGMDPVDAAVWGLYEKTGYHSEITDFIYLGIVQSGDTETFLYAIDVTSLPQHDLTEEEHDLAEEDHDFAGTETEWLSERQLLWSGDPLLITMYSRLKDWMKYGNDIELNEEEDYSAF